MTEFLREWHSNSTVVQAHTSGSTGMPKDIALLKEDMRVSARNTIKHFRLKQGAVLAIPLSADYIAGKMMAVRADICGGELLELPVSNRIELNRHVDLIAIVPSQIQSVLNLPSGLIGAMLIGGAPMSSQQELAVARSGIEAWVGYGMTETCSHVALRRVGEGPEYHSVGDIWFSTTNEGCLVIHSLEFSWHELTTRDVVRLTSPNTFEWLGRADNVIISGGKKIHPEALEKEIRQLIPSLPDFYVVGAPDDKWGQVPVMVVEGRVDSENILNALKADLADPHHLPHNIIATDALPRTANNKYKRILISYDEKV